MAKTAIVGRVAVKVLPDTSDFRRDLKDDLSKVAQGEEVYVDIAFSLNQMKKALLEKVKSLNADIRTSDVYKIVVGLKVEANAETYKDLKRAIHEVQAAASMQDIQIGTKVDVPRDYHSKVTVKPEMDRNALAKIGAMLDNLNAKAKLQLRVNNKDLAFAREAMANALNEKFNLRVGVDGGSLAKAKAAVQSVVGDTWFNIHVRADEIRAAKEEAKLRRIIGDFETDIKPRLSSAAVNLVKAELQTLFNKASVGIKTAVNPANLAQSKAILRAAFNDIKVGVKAVLDKKSFQVASQSIYRLTGARLAAKKFLALDYLLDLDTALPKIAGVTTAVGLLGTSLISTTGNILSLSQSIAQIVPGLLALPGILASVGVAFASAMLALKDFGKQVPEVKGMMDQLMSVNSAAFWEQAREPMRDLVTNWQPKVVEGFRQIGASNGNLFGTFARDAQEILSSRLDVWFAAVAEGLDNFVAVGGSAGLANIIKGFGDLGAVYFPMLWKWLGEITSQFGTWLTAAVSSGQAMDWVAIAVTQLQALFGVVLNLGLIFANLATAASAAGGSTLSGLRDALQGIAAVTANPVFQGQLTEVFAAAFEAMNQISTSAGPALTAIFGQWQGLLVTLLPMIGQIGALLVNAIGVFLTNPAVTAGVQAIFGGILTAIQILSPQVDALSAGIGAFFQLIGVAATSVAPLLAAAMQSAGDAATGVLGALTQVVPLLSGGFFTAFQALEPVINALSGVMATLIVQIGTALANAFVYLAPMLDAFGAGLNAMFATLGPVLGAVITQLVNGLAPVLGIVFEALGNLMVALAPVIASLGGALSAALAVILPAIQQAAANLLPKMVDALSNLGAALKPVIDGIAKFLRDNQPAIAGFLAFLIETIGSALPNFINGIANVVSGVTNIINGIITVFKGVFTGNWKMVWDGAKQILSGAWDAIKGIVEIALNVGVLGILRGGWSIIKSLFTDGPNFLKNAWKVLWQTIKDVTTLGWNGLKSYFFNGWEGVYTLCKANAEKLKKLWDGMWKMINATVTGAWSTIKSSFTTGVEAAFGVVKSLPDKIKGIFTNASSFLADSGKAIMDGLAGGIRNGIDGAVRAAKSAMEAVSRLFPHSPAKEGPFSGRGWTPFSGMAIAEGLAEGIRKKSDLVPSAAMDMMDSTHDVLNASASFAGVSRGSVDFGSKSETNYINLEVHVDDLLKVNDLNEYLRAQRQRKRQRMGG